MGLAGRLPGPRGFGVLALTAAAGIALGVHGWGARHSALPSGSLAGGPKPRTTSASPSPRQAGPAAPTAGPAGTASASPAAGPLLRSQSYAAYSFQVWPGTPTAPAKAATTGLSITVRRQGSGISVTAGVSGQPPSAPQFYAHGAKVYVIEASMGDDSGNSDYSLGDDGLVVTDAAGRILQ
jgi:hypothetical protein